jgi:hypothetical protein
VAGTVHRVLFVTYINIVYVVKSRELHQLRRFSLKCSPLGLAGPAAAPPPFIDNNASRKDSI